MSRAGRHARFLTLAALTSTLTTRPLGGGCEGCQNEPLPAAPEPYQHREQAASIEEEIEPPDPDEPPPPAIAPTPVQPASRDGRDREPPPTVPSLQADREYASSDPAVARRYVYRVRMIVPAALGSGEDRVAMPAAELFVDVSHERLRARFGGRGWPVPAGAEVRLRRDRPGAYLFDGQGGRPLEPGELASWFEGGPVTRRGPPLRIFGQYGFPRRQALPDDHEVPGELMCALLAEWATEEREPVIRRCERGAPHLWRLGFWRAEQTAGVAVELPRSSLRADEADPPSAIADESSRAFLEPEAFGRIEPAAESPAEPAEDAPAEGLRVINDSATRVIVSVQGVAAGWVDAGAQGWFVGLRPGSYEVGAIRPLGAVVQRGRAVSVPGTHRVCDGRCRD